MHYQFGLSITVFGSNLFMFSSAFHTSLLYSWIQYIFPWRLVSDLLNSTSVLSKIRFLLNWQCGSHYRRVNYKTMLFTARQFQTKNSGHDDGLMQKSRNSIALAMKLLLFCIMSSVHWTHKRNLVALLVSAVSILYRFDRVITGPHCIEN